MSGKITHMAPRLDGPAGNPDEAVAYLRVSGVSQIDGDGFPRQWETIERFAALKGWHIFDEPFKDEAVRGKTELEDRPALAALMDRIETSGCKIVLVERSDRIARDLIVGEVILRSFRDIGVKVYECEGGTELTASDGNPTTTLIRQVLGAVAQFEKTVLVMKLRAARDRKRRETGHCEGHMPFGLSKKYPYERACLDELIRLRDDQFLQFDEISAMLNALGYTRRSGGQWTKQTVWATYQKAMGVLGDASSILYGE